MQRTIRILAMLAMTAAWTMSNAEEASESGSDLFLSYQCWQCHGYEGQGGAAPRVAPSAYPYEAFVRFVRYPNLMPAYTTELLSDADLRAIYDYLQTIDPPKALEEIPALNDL